MTDQYTWPLSEIRTRFRTHIGRSTTAEISDANCNKAINDYYVNFFPEDAGVGELDDWLTQALSADDSGSYTLAQNVSKLCKPVTINNTEIFLEKDSQKFFRDYPEDEQYITEPTLAIGTDDATKVKHSAFSYDIMGYSYSKDTSEVALTGSAIPSGKYGAWSFRIDSDGTITVTAADDNASGYDTATIALLGLSHADSDSAYMGFVTVTKSDGVFTPATTELSAANVTDTYTDGKFQDRGDPQAACIYNGLLYVRPKSDDTMQLKSPIYKRPDAFTGDSDAPDDMRWGTMIAIGSAIQYLQAIGSTTRVQDLLPLAAYYRTQVRNKKSIQQSQRYSETGI